MFGALKLYLDWLCRLESHHSVTGVNGSDKCVFILNYDNNEKLTVTMPLTLIPMMSLMGLTSSFAATLGSSPREKAEAPATIWLNLNLS